MQHKYKQLTASTAPVSPNFCKNHPITQKLFSSSACSPAIQHGLTLNLPTLTEYPCEVAHLSIVLSSVKEH